VHPRAKVTIDSPKEVAYKESISTKMNDLDLCLEVVLRLCYPLRHILHWISRKPSEIGAWFQKATDRKWRRLWGIKWSRDWWRHVTRRSNSWPQYA